MLIASITIIFSIALLVWSADRFVAGSASLARNLGMSPLLIGLTIVSLGTSAPEILVSATAAMVGASGIAIGNAVGSNIANIGLVLGITALVRSLPVKSGLTRKELPLLAIISLGTGILLLDLNLSRMDGLILIAAMGLTLYLFAKYHPSPSDVELIHEEEEELPTYSTGKALLWFIVGLLILVASSRALVWAATGIAQILGVSDLLIGLTIIAIGTSLPELAASVASVLKGHHDIALGNVIGSNIFNLLAVMSIPAAIAPYAFSEQVLWRDYSFMLILTALLIAFCYLGIRRPRGIKIGRTLGGLFFLSYIGYLVLLYLQT
ncbi:MAG: calcium/sodium antiporter [Pseudomonadales bacterium]